MSATNLLTENAAEASRQSMTLAEDALQRHAALSWAEAHGSFTVRQQVYLDSGGDKVSDHVLEIRDASNEVAYCPCRQVTANGVNPAGTGVNETVVDTSTPTGSFLITGNDTFDQLAPSIEAAADSIEAHAVTRYTGVHGGVVISARDTVDSRNHRVGRKIVAIKVNGTVYNLIGDGRQSGPPQPPRVVLQSPTSVSLRRREDSWVVVVVTHGLIHGSDSPEALGTTITCNVFGSEPLDLQWQVSNDRIVWRNLPTDGADVRIPVPGWPHGFDIDARTATERTLVIHRAHPGDGQGWKTLYFRLRASNESIGGGVAFSTHFTYNVKDEDSWICTEVSRRTPLEDSAWKTLRKLRRIAWKTDIQTARLYFYQGSDLVNKMMAAENCDWNFYRERILHVVALADEGKEQEAYSCYREMVVHALEQHWPDSPWLSLK